MSPVNRLTLPAVVAPFLLLLPFLAPAQHVRQDSVLFRPEVERIFTDAVSLFKLGEYGQAAEQFDRILYRYPGTQRETAAYIMGAKSRYELGRFEEAQELLRELLYRYPGSTYIDDAHYTLGLVWYQLKRYENAVREFLAAWQTTGKPQLKDRAAQMLAVLTSEHLAIDQARRLILEAGSGEIRAMLSVRLAEKVLTRGDVEGAREILRPVVRMPRTVGPVDAAIALLERIEASAAVKIGVVLPLKTASDPFSISGVGEEILMGLQLAVDEHNAEAMPKVSLEVRDSERDATVAARQVSELSMENRVLAIVGPLFSHEAFAAAEIANAQGVPLITPTATANGIAAIGEYIFQANPDYAVRGRAMAQYAYRAANARRFAVLSASDTANKQMTAAFLGEVEKLGGEVVDVQWYNPGETDLQAQLFAIRQRAMEISEPVVVNFATRLRSGELKKLVQWGVPQRVLDSLLVANAMAPVEFLFGSDGIRIADSLKIPTQRVKAKFDSLEIPVTYIDAMFVPIASSSEIAIVTSQIRYFNFQTQLLGTGNWNDFDELDQNRQYANGAVFTTDVYWEEIDQQYRSFARGFRAAYSRNPTANAMIGYDAMRLILRLVRSGATRRDEIVSALSTVRNYQGIHSKIYLAEGRVNSCITFLRFKNRSIRRIAEVDVSRDDVRMME
ncbi:MAG: tetratricopeptide repeat protein [Ignavibacteria bacterium]|nr:tetratricopeptide repeat protein [Ignavibacteria bacterium]